MLIIQCSSMDLIERAVDLVQHSFSLWFIVKIQLIINEWNLMYCFHLYFLDVFFVCRLNLEMQFINCPSYKQTSQSCWTVHPNLCSILPLYHTAFFIVAQPTYNLGHNMRQRLVVPAVPQSKEIWNHFKCRVPLLHLLYK